MFPAFFHALINFFRSLSGARVIEFVSKIIEITSKIREIVESDVVEDLLELIFKGKEREELAGLKKLLDKAIKALNLPIDFSNAKSLESKIKVFTEYLKTLSDTDRSFIYKSLAVKILQMNEPELSNAQADTIIQNAFYAQKTGNQIPA